MLESLLTPVMLNSSSPAPALVVIKSDAITDKKYDEFLAASKFSQVLQRFRYFWEVVVYQLQEDN